MDLNQIMQLVKNGQNPQSMIMSMLEQYTQNNPVAKNLINLAKQGNTSQIEKIARNLVASRGGDFDKEFASFKQLLNI
jgi:hypothetical protein